MSPIPQTLFVLLLFASLLGSAELGFRIGGRAKSAPKEQVVDIQASVLGMLALLLGFTFSMAASRYDARRLLVVQEANAIGTTYLRASLLPQAHEAPVRDALRRYLDLRLSARAHASDPNKLASTLAATTQIQQELWKHATDAAREAPGPITATFVTALNELIDTDTARVAAGRAEIPYAVWLLLIVVALSAMFVTSYRAGVDNARNPFTGLFLPLLVTFVMVLIYDIAYPLQGIVDVGQRPLVELQQSMTGQ